MSLFKPKVILNRFSQLNLNELNKIGIKIILIDIDNTICYPGSGRIDLEALNFIDKIKEHNILPIIFSNNNKKRVVEFVGDLHIEWHYYSMKPLPFSFWNIMRKYKCTGKQIAVIGDQLITDILGANLSGCYGIYTKQLYETDTPITKFNRIFERFIWKRVLHEKV